MKIFYDEIDSSLEQRLAITNVIIELTFSSRRSGVVKNISKRNNKFGDDMVVFCEMVGRPPESPKFSFI